MSLSHIFVELGHGVRNAKNLPLSIARDQTTAPENRLSDLNMPGNVWFRIALSRSSSLSENPVGRDERCVLGQGGVPPE